MSDDETAFLREKVQQQAREIEELVKKIAEVQMLGEQGLKFASDAIRQIRALAGLPNEKVEITKWDNVVDTGFGSTLMTLVTHTEKMSFGHFQAVPFKDEKDISGAV